MSDIDDITVEYVEDGVVTLKELDKVILTRGAWTTILFKVQSWSRTKESYDPMSYTIRRYQKRGGEFKQRSKFNISNKEQAEKIIAALSKWMQEEATTQSS
jgi:hypothetical protein